MNLKIIEEKQNPLFKRKEIAIEIRADVAPNYSEVTRLLAEKFSAKEDSIKIKKIAGEFGSNDFVIIANIYPSKEEKDSMEIKTKQELEAEKKVEAEKSETARAEAEKQEAPNQRKPVEETGEKHKTEEVAGGKKNE